MHCALLVHPARHVPPRQIGVAVFPQSEFVTHATHALLLSQNGVAPEQSVFAWHCTHCCVVDKQILAAVGQSVAVRHPTQAPVVVSQWGVAPPQTLPPSPAQDA